MFRGEFEHTVDGKGRTSLPARFREVLAASGSDRMVVTRDVERCLLLFPLAQWEAFERRLLELPSMAPGVRLVKRTLIGSAHEVSVDANGRILIPQPLREYADLKREVVFAGQIDRIELWNRDAWRTLQSQVDPAALQEAMEGLGI
ncbi:MAG: division/cell wall cluster transcriptional repressor MraZ [Deltaproteobacteria bacterium]|nr:MAG: division/cell wall cluster transcriptional repressor MraZ [Deltaproteobacteria bacterium]